MRKIALTILSYFFILSVSSAQIWLEVGPKASFGPSGYLNSTIANDAKHDYSLNLAYNFGAAIGINIGDVHGINIEGLWGTYFQDITSHPMPDMTLRNVVEWEVFDIYTLYRFYPESGMYLELGSKFTQIQDLSQREGVVELDVKGMYEDSYISGVIGVGAFLSGSKILVIKSGLRFEYGITDFVSAAGVEQGFPLFKSDLGGDPGKTTPFRVSFGIEISFGVGGVAQSSCGRRGFVLGGRY